MPRLEAPYASFVAPAAEATASMPPPTRIDRSAAPAAVAPIWAHGRPKAIAYRPRRPQTTMRTVSCSDPTTHSASVAGATPIATHQSPITDHRSPGARPFDPSAIERLQQLGKIRIHRIVAGRGAIGRRLAVAAGRGPAVVAKACKEIVEARVAGAVVRRWLVAARA